ncbi:hypothetical protein Tco_1548619 [Tanacetum coccineum]
MVINSPCLTDIKNWLVQKQTAFGKDFSNLFTADSLLKTIWFLNHHASYAPCYSNEALAIPEQTATGKEISNPFMAGEDCWVLEDFTTYCCWFNIGAASEDLGPQKPEISDLDDNYTEHSTCQSNDSEGSCGNTSEHSFETESESVNEPNELSKSRLEVPNEKDVSAPKSKEVEPSCVSHIKTPRQPLKDKETHTVNRKNWNDMMERELGEGYSFTKKKCFVCGSLNHLIKDCDYYEKKMAREAEVKRVVNTGNGVAKPVWTNANRINHANQFVPRSVQLNAGRPKFNTVRPNINTGRTNINSGRPKVNAVSPKVNTVRSQQPVTHKTSNSSSPKRPQMNQMNQRWDFSKSYSSVRRPFANSTAQMANSNAVMGSWGSAVKTSASYNWRNTRPNFNYNSGPTFIRTEHPLKNMVDRGIFDSGCSGHMTGNKDQLEDFEEFNGGSVTFGGSKGYISGKGRIRVGNLDFDSVSFVKELGHFNLFSISRGDRGSVTQ